MNLKNLLLKLVLASLSLVSIAVFAENGRLYVKPGGTGDGSSWAKAVGSVDAALALLTQDCKTDLWFAVGEFKLTKKALIPRTVSLYGGFSGNETSLEQRDMSKKTTICGGAFPTLLAEKRNEGQDPTYIDGFIFTGTNQVTVADGGVAGNIELRGGRNISNCIIRENGYQKCGGVYAGEDAMIVNCLFYKNITTLASACVTIGATAQVINCTIVNNFGDKNSWGGLRVSGVDTKIVNTVIWGNSKTEDGVERPYQVRIDADGYGTFDHCAIQGELSGGAVSWKTPKQMISCLNLNAGNDHAAGPGFVNVVGDDYQLKNESPLLNKGNNAFVATIPTDLLGKQRVQGGTVDMGAYEAANGAGFDAVYEGASLIAYPNPVKDIVVVIADNAIRAEVYTLAGSLVYQSGIETNGQLNLSDLTPGYYQLVVYTHNGIRKMPVVKQ
ncbi:MAG: choice-of-anchor Q domain-containing protein [Bacteroidales bacterium]